MSDAAKQAEALRACLKSIERLLIAMDAANAAPFVPGQALAANVPADLSRALSALKLIATASPGEHAFEYMRNIARAAMRAAAPAPEAKPEAQQPLGDEQRRAILAECGWVNAQTQDAERNRQVLFSFRRTIDRIEQACAEAWGVKLAGIGASGEAS